MFIGYHDFHEFAKIKTHLGFEYDQQSGLQKKAIDLISKEIDRAIYTCMTKMWQTQKSFNLHIEQDPLPQHCHCHG
jgi:hypothetical protein